LTHGYFLAEDSKEQLIMRPYSPLGILYISAYLEQNNFTNEVYDSTFGSLAELKNLLENEKPDLMVFIQPDDQAECAQNNRVYKRFSSLQHTKIILGGPEVTQS